MSRREARQAAGDSYAVAASYRLAPGAQDRDGSGPPPRAPYAGPGADAARARRRQRPALAVRRWRRGARPAGARPAGPRRDHAGRPAADFHVWRADRGPAALLDRLRFPPAVVVGMSMGAGVAASLALRQPFRVRGLVLIRPAWLDTGPPGNLLPLSRPGGCCAGMEPGPGWPGSSRPPSTAASWSSHRPPRPASWPISARRTRSAAPSGSFSCPARRRCVMSATCAGSACRRWWSARPRPAAPLRDRPDLGVRLAGEPPGVRARVRRGPGRIPGLPDRGVRPARRARGRGKDTG